jgi:hypothetical protein
MVDCEQTTYGEDDKNQERDPPKDESGLRFLSLWSWGFAVRHLVSLSKGLSCENGKHDG